MQSCYACITSDNSPDDVYQELLAEQYQTHLNKPDRLDDADFMVKLFYGTMKRQEFYLQLLAEKMENWDMRRVALVDKIILMMALNELLHFEDIPIKVTLNEYIDLARVFSTEKSGQFVNGVLDAVHLALSKEGKIHKSPRGLIDTTI
jgi:transcription antitermination protein NusB